MTLVAPIGVSGFPDPNFIPVGVEAGQQWTISGPDGTVANFNNKLATNYVGAITDVTGLDSPDIRENADDLVQMDGGIHGDFFYGRRPITMTGKMYDMASVAERNVRVELLKRATNAVRMIPGGTGIANANGNARLSWTPTGASSGVFIDVRRQQPLRVTGGWAKDFQIQFVAADPRIYSQTLYGATSLMNVGVACVNYGNTVSFPIYAFTVAAGATITNPKVYNGATGSSIQLLSTFAGPAIIEIDTLNRTVTIDTTINGYQYVDFASTTWDGLSPGSFPIVPLASSFTGTVSMNVYWHDAYL